MADKELRVEVPEEDLAILDGYVQASGASKASVIRMLLKKWSQERLHESIVICRMVRINPLEQESSRIPGAGEPDLHRSR